jgi:hypothetical protein
MEWRRLFRYQERATLASGLAQGKRADLVRQEC